jgi:hypothetical protein
LLSAFGCSFGGTPIVGTSIPLAWEVHILNLPDAGRNPAGAHPVAQNPSTAGEVLVGDANFGTAFQAAGRTTDPATKKGTEPVQRMNPRGRSLSAP